MEKGHKILLTAIVAQTVLVTSLVATVLSLVVKPVVRTVTKVEKVLVTPSPSPKLLAPSKGEKVSPVATSGALSK